MLCKSGKFDRSGRSIPEKPEILNKNFRPAYCNGQCSMLNHDSVYRIFEEAKQTERHGFRLEG